MDILIIHVGDTVLSLFLLCPYWTYSIVSFVSVLRSRDRQSRGSHYCVYIYLDIYTHVLFLFSSVLVCLNVGWNGKPMDKHRIHILNLNYE